MCRWISGRSVGIAVFLTVWVLLWSQMAVAAPLVAPSQTASSH